MLTFQAGPTFPVTFGCMIQTISIEGAEDISKALVVDRILIHGLTPWF